MLLKFLLHSILFAPLDNSYRPRNIVACLHLQIFLSKHYYKHVLTTVIKHFTLVGQKFPVLCFHQFLYRPEKHSPPSQLFLFLCERVRPQCGGSCKHQERVLIAKKS